MASVYDDIRQAFEVELNSIVGIPDIAWENVDFEPQTGSSYIRATLVPTRRLPSAVGDNFLSRYDGFYEIMVYCPKGNGPSTADDLANTIIETFEPNKEMTVNGTVVSTRYAEREQGVSDESRPFYYIPVIIGWYCYR